MAPAESLASSATDLDAPIVNERGRLTESNTDQLEPSCPQPESSVGETRESGECFDDDPDSISDQYFNYMLEVTYNNAPTWLQTEIEKLISFAHRRSSEMGLQRASKPRSVKYLLDFCIDCCGSTEQFRSPSRYDVINRVPFPVRPLQSQICFNCGEPGHPVKDCSHPREPDIIRENVRLFKAAQIPKSESNRSRYYHEKPTPDYEPSKRVRNDEKDRRDWNYIPRIRNFQDQDSNRDYRSRPYENEPNRRKSDSYRY